MQAIHEMNNAIIFDHQIKVEVASKGMLDLPAEIIHQINNKLPLQDEKHLREVCLGCPVLRQIYKDEIEESGVMKVNLCKFPCDLDLCLKFVNDFNFLVSSNMLLSLILPPQYELTCYVISVQRWLQIVWWFTHVALPGVGVWCSGRSASIS